MSRAILGGLLIAAIAATDAFPQASVPPRGSGSIAFSLQKIDHTGHILTDGSVVRVGQSTNRDFYIEGEYGVTDRLAVTFGLPYVFSKYIDPNPPPPVIPYLPVDQCHCWNSGFQDFNFTARYNAIGRRHSAFKLTPSLSLGAPSHDYDFRGEAVLGRNLRELRFGLDGQQRIDSISEKLYVQGHYSYAFVEHVLGIPNNRSNAVIEGDYLLTEKLSVRGKVILQRTHGGLHFPSDLTTPELIYQHDRLLRDNYSRAGTGASYSFQRMDVFFDFVGVLGGTDTHAGRALTLGVSFPFKL